MNKVIYNKLSTMCVRKEICIFDATQFLAKYKNITNIERDEIIAKLLEEHFIDEERYAKAFVHDAYKYNKWGKLKIIAKLKTKRINQNAIDKALSTIDIEEYESIKEELIQNKSKTLSANDPQKEIKIKRFLYSRGFIS